MDTPRQTLSKMDATPAKTRLGLNRLHRRLWTSSAVADARALTPTSREGFGVPHACSWSPGCMACIFIRAPAQHGMMRA